jgi:hypothetical protein
MTDVFTSAGEKASEAFELLGVWYLYTRAAGNPASLPKSRIILAYGFGGGLLPEQPFGSFDACDALVKRNEVFHE